MIRALAAVGAGAVLTSAWVFLPTAAHAQGCEAPLTVLSSPFPSYGCSPALQTQSGTGPSPARAFLLSAVLPGLGQRGLSQSRWWAYAAAEAGGWTWWAFTHSDATGLRTDYRDLAWDEARIQTGRRVDGDFEYYESLMKFDRSGAFDVDGQQFGIQPETDPGSFNGQTWQLARDIFFGSATEPQPGDPTYQRALDFYMDRAVRPEFAWDWRGDEQARNRYDELIEESDDAFRRASSIAVGIALNHFVSAVDAYFSARARTLTNREVHLLGGWRPDVHGLGRWVLGLRVGIR